MKSYKFMAILVLTFVTLIAVGSCATMKSPEKLTYERFCGVWANEDYEPKPGLTTPSAAKWIINPDGTLIGYEYLIQTGPTYIGLYTVEKRWIDSEGNSFYHVKIYKVLQQGTQYELWKINKYNSVFEVNWSNVGYPEKIDPTDWHSSYHIFYRY